MKFHWPSWFSPRFDWLQVEVSSCCNAACNYCPHTLYADTWQSRLMTAETFRQLLPILPRVHLVYLQGWGEPFLNPNFFEFVRLAKTAGCRVGATTNGMLLNEETCLRLVQEGVDVIAFTLAGVDEQNDRIRKGTSLEKVLEAVRLINRIKQQLDSSTPVIHVAYMLLRSQIDAFSKLPDLLKDLKISQVTVSTLDFVGHPSLGDEAILPETDQENNTLRSRLDAVVNVGRQFGISIDYYLAAPPGSKQGIDNESAGDTVLSFLVPSPEHCTENIHRAAFISADGRVSPCVFMNIPVSAATYTMRGAGQLYGRMTFGDCSATPLEVVWRSKSYAAFRGDHREHTLPDFCRTCIKPKLASSTVSGHFPVR